MFQLRRSRTLRQQMPKAEERMETNPREQETLQKRRKNHRLPRTQRRGIQGARPDGRYGRTIRRGRLDRKQRKSTRLRRLGRRNKATLPNPLAHPRTHDTSGEMGGRLRQNCFLRPNTDDYRRSS